MRRTTNFLAVAALASLAAAWAAPGAAAEYEVDGAHTVIGFKVRHILTRLPGRFKDVTGAFTFDAKAPERANGIFTVKAASIDTGVEKRDAHLRSEDFFWAEKYPDLTLAVRKLTPAGPGRYTARADLTIRGVTKGVALEVEYLGAAKTPWGTSVVSFEARGKINRKDFGLNWNKVLEGGSVLVGNEVELELDVEAVAKVN